MNSRDLKAMREWVAQQTQLSDEYRAWLKRGAPKDDSFATKFYSRARFGGMALK